MHPDKMLWVVKSEMQQQQQRLGTTHTHTHKIAPHFERERCGRILFVPSFLSPEQRVEESLLLLAAAAAISYIRTPHTDIRQSRRRQRVSKLPGNAAVHSRRFFFNISYIQQYRILLYPHTVHPTPRDSRQRISHTHKSLSTKPPSSYPLLHGVGAPCGLTPRTYYIRTSYHRLTSSLLAAAASRPTAEGFKLGSTT